MNYHLNNVQKMNEIIFANRNKAYGAYEIRSTYGSTVVKSLSMMALTMGSIMSIAYYLSHSNEPPVEEKSTLIIHDSVFVIPFGGEEEEEEVKPEEKIEAKKTDPASGAETSNSTRISDTVAVANTSTVSAASIGTAAVTDPNALGGTSTTSTNTASSARSGITSTTSTVRNIYEVDELPKFKGGLTALNAFIRSQIKYPEEASSNGESGTVYARFVVDEEGNVSAVELQRALTPSLNAEATRVLKLIPKFESPGKAKGEPVKTYFQLPIRFSLH